MVQEPASSAMYPSLEELTAALVRGDPKLPLPLIEELRRRYDAHGWEYATPNFHTDGRVVNECLYSDSIVLAREEVIDAVFNLLVANFKERKGWKTQAALRLCLKTLAYLQ